ncbi:hypothetical protein SKAU_G00010680 [Synaphobranchus kaupii]|uniref:Uncharacterized protein n=1 Tax=Synaphobranchus kaupii TaxID=118154 RepID=A0A9Q1GB16_SYNKA|nr:hypothetical protein SKAU_G00010680 [Synaphobranchus kaupii]
MPPVCAEVSQHALLSGPGVKMARLQHTEGRHHTAPKRRCHLAEERQRCSSVKDKALGSQKVQGRALLYMASAVSSDLVLRLAWVVGPDPRAGLAYCKRSGQLVCLGVPVTWRSEPRHLFGGLWDSRPGAERTDGLAFGRKLVRLTPAL